MPALYSSQYRCDNNLRRGSVDYTSNLIEQLTFNGILLNNNLSQNLILITYHSNKGLAFRRHFEQIIYVGNKFFQIKWFCESFNRTDFLCGT